MGEIDHGSAWPPAIRVELTASEDRQDGSSPAEPMFRMECRVNLDPSDVAYVREMEFSGPDGARARAEQIMVDDSLFMRGRMQRPGFPDEGNDDWTEVPPQALELLASALAQQSAGGIDAPDGSPLIDLTGLGELPMEERTTDWERLLADALGADGVLECLPDEMIDGRSVHRYRARFAKAADTVLVNTALNRAIAAGCEAFPLGQGSSRPEVADLPCVMEIWTGVEDRYPYRATITSEEEGRRVQMAVISTPMSQPFEITRPA